jgi:hypothetical protein
MVNEKIKGFANFLNTSLADVNALIENQEDFLMDWMQASWELLVERSLLSTNEFLEIYGVGADLYGSSSRVTEKNAVPTHKIVMFSSNENNYVLDLLSNQNVEIKNTMVFEEFVSFTNGFYSNKPSFDCILATEIDVAQERVFCIQDIEFKLEKIHN